MAQNNQELPRYEVETLDLKIIGSSNDTEHFENPALTSAFENFKKELTITGGADGALDPELNNGSLKHQLHGDFLGVILLLLHILTFQ